MEQKKTLWIIAAVGAFLLVVLGFAGILYSPAKNLKPTVQQVATSTTTTQTPDSGWTTVESTGNKVVTNTTTTTTPSAQKVGDMIVVSDNTTVYGLQQNPTAPVTAPTETTIDLNALKSELQQTTTPVQPNINITVNVPDSEKQNLGMTQNTTTNTTVQNVLPPQLTETNEVVKTPSVEENKVKVVKADKKNEEKKVAPVVEKVESKPAVTKKVTPKKEEKKVEKKVTSQYWVQVASYSNKKAAENARSILDSNKISSDIFTYEDKKDDLYFRVRVGPYMTESEAEYWKARILKIPFFENNDSYVTKTTK